MTTQAVVTEACHMLLNHENIDVVTNFSMCFTRAKSKSMTRPETPCSGQQS